MSKLDEILAKAKAKANGAAGQQESGGTAQVKPATGEGGSVVAVPPTQQVPRMADTGTSSLRGAIEEAKKATGSSLSDRLRAAKKGQENGSIRTSVSTELPPAPKAVPVPVARPTVDVPSVPQPQQSNVEISGYDEFRNNLNYLASHIEEKEIVGQVLRTILVQLQKNPHFKDQLGADGVLKPSMNLVVRGLRRAYATAARFKQEKRSKKAQADDDVAALERELAEAGFSL